MTQRDQIISGNGTQRNLGENQGHCQSSTFLTKCYQSGDQVVNRLL
jgi:hypothetical protein